MNQNQPAAEFEHDVSPPVGRAQETLASWLLTLSKNGIKSLPQTAKTMILQLAFVIAVQLVFWWEGIARFIPAFIKSPVIFLTATYNNVVPKTIYWVIIFTFGKKLWNRIRKTGFKKALRPIGWMIPEFKKAMDVLNRKAILLLFAGGGIGLVIANNFSSYSRFSGARNKMDKYFVSLVISFTVAYLLGESKNHWLFKFTRLASGDFCRAFKLKNPITDDHTFVFLSAFVAGLLLDAPLILMQMKYGGYILGGLLIAAGVLLQIFVFSKKGAGNDNS